MASNNGEARKRHIEALEADAVEVSLSVKWYTQTARLGEEYDRQVRDVLEVKAGAISTLTKRLFPASHEAVKKASAAKADLIRFRDSHSLPISALTSSRGARVKDPGRRMVMASKLPSFLAGIESRKATLLEAIIGLQANLEEIKEEAKRRLGPVYKETDYPDSVTDLVDVVVGTPRAISVVASLQQFDKEMYEQHRARVQEQINSSVNLYLGEFIEGLQDTLLSLSRQLDNRVRIRPVQGSYRKYWDAEVLEEKPEGDGFILSIKLKETTVVGDGVKKKSEVIELPVMTRAEIDQNLRPRRTDEKRKLSTSVVDGLQAKVREFRGLADAIGPAGEGLKAKLDKIEEFLGDDDDERLVAMRTQEGYRAMLKEGFASLAVDLQGALEEVVPAARKIRKNVRGVRGASAP